MRKYSDVAVYKGDNLLAIGTVDECAAALNVKPDTIRFYLTPSYQKKLARRKKHCGKGYLTVTHLGDDEDE